MPRALTLGVSSCFLAFFLSPDPLGVKKQTGKDFVLTAADTRAVRSIVVFKNDEDKTKQLSDKVLMLFSGEPGDTVNVTKKNSFFRVF